MKEYPSIKNASLSHENISKLRNYFKWSGPLRGNNTHVTHPGGIHYTGKQTTTKSIFFEIKRKTTYVGILLYEYPKGVIFHVYFPFPKVLELSKNEMNLIIEPIYQKITEMLKK